MLLAIGVYALKVGAGILTAALLGAGAYAAEYLTRPNRRG